MSDVLALGECMVELSLSGGGQAAIGYGGDTFNTAVYLSRLGLKVGYATAVGAEDPFSRGMLELMAEEGVGVEQVVQAPGRLPGLYAIERGGAGRRRFFYWRSDAPVRQLFQLADRSALQAALLRARLIYLSGITLAVLGDAGCAALQPMLAQAKAAGAAVAFDPNFRAPLWPEPALARAAAEAVVGCCRYVSASAEDLEALYGRPAEAVAADWAKGGAEVVLRTEDLAVTVCGPERRLKLPGEPPVPALDSTGAGDSFNAAYLGKRLQGRPIEEAVAAARRLSRIVVQHVGAIIPRAATPGV